MIRCHSASSKPDIVSCGSAAPPTRVTTMPAAFDVYIFWSLHIANKSSRQAKLDL